MTATQSVVVNRLLAGLGSTERNRILTNCETLHLEFGTILCEPNRPYDYVYFPLTSFISLVTTLDDHQPLEMGLVGNEGMLGATLALGTKIAPLSSVVQGAGSALRMSAAHLQEHFRASVNFRNAINRYLYILILQLSQSAACLHFHAIEPRLARWLLMTHDRAHANHFHLTHEFLADMLGVRRSGVTIAAGALQDKKLIHYTRGEITIIDRDGLEQAACGCYAAMTESYRHLSNESIAIIS
jgi:CRP-like cAMP-binding protein